MPSGRGPAQRGHPFGAGGCRRPGINLAEYLHDVLERLPTATTTAIAALTPSGWLQAKRQATRQHA